MALTPTLILERIKRRWLLVRAPRFGETGFSKAFWTIMDANVTTISASVLSQLGGVC